MCRPTNASTRPLTTGQPEQRGIPGFLIGRVFHGPGFTPISALS